jgi:hypothetical protein
MMCKSKTLFPQDNMTELSTSVIKICNNNVWCMFQAESLQTGYFHKWLNVCHILKTLCIREQF